MSARFSGIACAAFVAAFTASCRGPSAGDAVDDVVPRTSGLTAQQRLTACAQDPRVVTGLATADVCAGAGIFFQETFGGNGRTCGSCHPANNNFTIDAKFIATLPPTDPLFVFEQDPADLGPDGLGGAGLETDSLRAAGGVLENVDDFQDPRHKFVIRSVPHVLSMSTTISADPADPATTTPPAERTGWGGDGAPGGGALRDFLNGAIKQHYTKTLQRREGVDFRLATSQELDLVRTFQLALGRLNVPDLTQVNLADAQAQVGRDAYLDPLRGRCQVCHLNGGANFQDTNLNRNFDTGTRLATNNSFTIPTFAGVALFDGGFGGQGLATPNIVTNPIFGDATPNNGFGNNTFNTPPVIEAADTLPSFHSNFFGGGSPETSNIENVVTFYAGLFQGSPAALALNARFGAPANVGPDIATIARFLRALNVALNIDMAKQRLRASQTILNRFHDQSLAIQTGLITLAVAEIDDALEVLQDPATPQPFYPVAVDRLNLAKSEIAAALAGATYVQRQGPLSNAISRTENARDQIGANVTFNLGTGNLFF
jgi:hypothetical protein